MWCVAVIGKMYKWTSPKWKEANKEIQAGNTPER